MRLNFEFRNWQEMLLTFRESGNCPTGKPGHYAAPNFCQRNCPVISVASDQLTIGGMLEPLSHEHAVTDSTGTVVVANPVLTYNYQGKDLDGNTITEANFNETSVQISSQTGSSTTIEIEYLEPGNSSFSAPSTTAAALTLFKSQTSAKTYVVKYTSKTNSSHFATRVINIIPDLNQTTLGLLNNKYSHLNFDADICDKCLLMNGRDTSTFTQALVKTPSLAGNAVQVWANYAIVSNEERKRMACAPRDILIEQIQTTPSANFGGQSPFPITNSNTANSVQSYDIRFSHAVKVIFFGAKNTTFKTIHSNYSTGIPCLSKQSCNGCLSVQALVGSGHNGKSGDKLLYSLGLSSVAHNNDSVNYHHKGESSLCDIVKVNTNVVGCCNGSDPIASASLVYENTCRLCLMSNEYYNQIQPYYHAVSIPSDKDSPVFCAQGLHMYSYSLDFMSLDPLGSTNFGKLTNVSLNVMPSNNWGIGACVSNQSLQVLYDKNGNTLPTQFQQQLADNSSVNEVEDIILSTYQGDHKVEGGLELIDSIKNTQKFSFQFVCSAVSNNIVRISGGALGFPVL